jgi:hypothetical protein
VFRAKYLELLQRKLADGQEALLADLRRVEWVVYAKRPFAGPEKVLDYFGRHTHRLAISNHRLVCHQDGLVTFRWKDYADDNRTNLMALGEQEFLRRFLQHVVPRRFVRIRRYGLLAARGKTERLARCRALLPTRAPPPTRITLSAEEFLRRVCSEDPFRCPVCRVGQMTSRGPLVRPPRSATSRGPP